MRRHVLLLLALAPTSAQAQPFSESMMDCAALHQNAAQYVKTDAEAEVIMQVARTWAASAVVQTATEGAPLDEAKVWERIDAKTDDWEARGRTAFFTQDFRDWVAYCRAFGRSRGLDVVPGLPGVAP